MLSKIALLAGELFGASSAKAAPLPPTETKPDPPPFDLTTYFAVQSEPTKTPPTDRRVFDVDLVAEPGYAILRCVPRPLAAASEVNVGCALTDGGRKARFHYELDPMTAGSGFWDGVIVLQQRRAPSSQ